MTRFASPLGRGGWELPPHDNNKKSVRIAKQQKKKRDFKTYSDEFGAAMLLKTLIIAERNCVIAAKGVSARWRELTASFTFPVGEIWRLCALTK